MTNREAFEVWGRTQFGRGFMVQASNGPYVWDHVECAWNAWQAGQAGPAGPAVELAALGVEASRYRWLRDIGDSRWRPFGCDMTQFERFHYPEEWGPSDARRLTCVCGNDDPFHADPPAPKATLVSACQWPAAPRSDTFRVKKEDPKDEHSPWFLVMPGNYMLAFNHCPDDAIDEARTNWVAFTLNAALAEARRLQEPSATASDSEPDALRPAGEKT